MLGKTTAGFVTGVAVHVFKISQALFTLNSFIGRVLVNVIDVSF